MQGRSSVAINVPAQNSRPIWTRDGPHALRRRERRRASARSRERVHRGGVRAPRVATCTNHTCRLRRSSRRPQVGRAAAAGRRPGLPTRVAVVPGLQLRCTEEGAIECFDARRDRTMRTRLGGVSRAAVEELEELEELARRGQPFAPAELPGCDDLERVAVVARLLGLGVLCDAEALHAVDDDGADGAPTSAGGRAGGARGGGGRSKRSGGRR